MSLKNYLKSIAIGGLLLILYTPYIYIITKSLNIGGNGHLFEFFVNSLKDQLYHDGLIVSLSISILSTLFSAITAILLLSLVQYFELENLMKYFIALFALPLFFPDTLLGLIYALGFKIYGLPLGIFSLIISYSITGICFLFMLLNIFFGKRIASLFLAARDLGAGFFQTLIKVVFPMIAQNALFVSSILFIFLLNEFTIAFFVSGASNQTLPLAIYSSIRYGMKPELFAISTILLLIGIFIFFTSIIYFLRKRHTE